MEDGPPCAYLKDRGRSSPHSQRKWVPEGTHTLLERLQIALLLVLRHSRLAPLFKLLQPHTCLHQKYTKARNHVLPCPLPGKTGQHTTSFHLAPEFLVTRYHQLLVDVHVRIHQLSPISY